MRRVSPLVIGLVTAVLSFVAGCGNSPPPAAELIEPDSTLLAETTFEDGRAVLVRKSSGELAVTLWSAGERSSYKAGTADRSRPVVGWVKGVQTVGGVTEDGGAAQVEVLVEAGKPVTGKVQNGAYVVAWPSALPIGRFVLRILDDRGQELYRWSPAGGSLAARTFFEEEDLS